MRIRPTAFCNSQASTHNICTSADYAAMPCELIPFFAGYQTKRSPNSILGELTPLTPLFSTSSPTGLHWILGAYYRRKIGGLLATHKIHLTAGTSVTGDMNTASMTMPFGTLNFAGLRHDISTPGPGATANVTCATAYEVNASVLRGIGHSEGSVGSVGSVGSDTLPRTMRSDGAWKFNWRRRQKALNEKREGMSKKRSEG